MELRRSTRLAENEARKSKLENNYLVIRKKIIKEALPIVKNKDDLIWIQKLCIVRKVVSIINTNWQFIQEFDYIKEFDRIKYIFYQRSFDWLITATENSSLKECGKFIKEFKKFRTKYEKTRYASWYFLREKYNLDANVMMCIDKYI